MSYPDNIPARSGRSWTAGRLSRHDSDSHHRFLNTLSTEDEAIVFYVSLEKLSLLPMVTPPFIGAAKTFRFGANFFLAKFEEKILLLRRVTGAEGDFC